MFFVRCGVVRDTPMMKQGSDRSARHLRRRRMFLRTEGRETDGMHNKIAVVILLCLTYVLPGCAGGDSSLTPSGPSPLPLAQAVIPPEPRAPSSWLTGYTLTAVSLSGAVYELTPTGRVPIPGARIYCEPCGTETHTFVTADENGFYIFPAELANGGGVWLSGKRTPIFVENNGYTDPAGVPFFPNVCPRGFSCREVLINGDTRFDIELVRQ
jgi:hypothetical protein